MECSGERIASSSSSSCRAVTLSLSPSRRGAGRSSCFDQSRAEESRSSRQAAGRLTVAGCRCARPSRTRLQLHARLLKRAPRRLVARGARLVWVFRWCESRRGAETELSGSLLLLLVLKSFELRAEGRRRRRGSSPTSRSHKTASRRRQRRRLLTSFQ